MRINKNIFWVETFANTLQQLGVKYVCISPGSRNTPLTIGFVNCKGLKKIAIIDERAAGFTALGLAKESGTPVVLICTSGTATAEFYPAVIEAYQQRIPLIVCTADRPPELQNVGANQSINQKNIYRNQIRYFMDVGIPSILTDKLKQLREIAAKAFNFAMHDARGPVHINFPFRKPFEPNAITDEINSDFRNHISEKITLPHAPFDSKKLVSSNKFFEVKIRLEECTRGLIIVGPENYNPLFAKRVTEVSAKFNLPILADGASQLRFGVHTKKNIIVNFDSMLRSKKFADKFTPDFILQFGRTVTSKGLEEFLDTSFAARFLVNEFGDWFDPSNKAKFSVKCKAYLFCELLTKHLKVETDVNRERKNFLDTITKVDAKIESIKSKLIYKSNSINETKIPFEIVNEIPNGVNLFISNSLPVRDFDNFVQVTKKNIRIYNNRGASGIDGIISTAAGIEAASKQKTYLMTGDLAFYYDLNSLLNLQKLKSKMKIILINNNGGGIFQLLPISEHKKYFEEFFKTPHNLNFEALVNAFGLRYDLAKNWKHFASLLRIKTLEPHIIELKTSSEESVKTRRDYWSAVDKSLSKH